MENEDNSGTDWKNKTATELLEIIYQYTSNGLRYGNAWMAKEWLFINKLSQENTMACYNSGQFYQRKGNECKEALLGIGLLKPAYQNLNKQAVHCNMFGSYSIMFPLKNETNQVVNFYSIGLRNDKRAYLNQKGLYPGYPPADTERLFVVDSVIEAASILETKALENREWVMALENGEILEQHTAAIIQLEQLKEIIQITRKQ